MAAVSRAVVCQDGFRAKCNSPSSRPLAGPPEIGRSSVQRRQAHGLSSNRGVACRAETKAPNSPSKSDRLLAEIKCTHESPPVRGYSQ